MWFSRRKMIRQSDVERTCFDPVFATVTTTDSNRAKSLTRAALEQTSLRGDADTANIYTVVIFVEWYRYTQFKGKLITSPIYHRKKSYNNHKHFFQFIHPEHQDKLRDLLQGIFQHLASSKTIDFGDGAIILQIILAAVETTNETER